MRNIPTAKVAPSVEVSPSTAPSMRKASMLIVAFVILSVMITWLGFLGWAVFAFLHWIIDWMNAGFPL